MEEPVQITPRQKDYLELMADHVQRSNASVSGLVGNQAHRTIASLVDRGFVRKITSMKPYHFQITAKGDEALTNHRIVPYYSKSKPPITEQEKRYLTILINSGMTGQERNMQFQVLFPHRTFSAINNMPHNNLRSGRMIR